MRFFNSISFLNAIDFNPIIAPILEVLNAMKISTGFVSEVFYYIGNGLIWLSTLFTLISGIIYLKDNIGFLKDN